MYALRCAVARPAAAALASSSGAARVGRAAVLLHALRHSARSALQCSSGFHAAAARRTASDDGAKSSAATTAAAESGAAKTGAADHTPQEAAARARQLQALLKEQAALLAELQRHSAAAAAAAAPKATAAAAAGASAPAPTYGADEAELTAADIANVSRELESEQFRAREAAGGDDIAAEIRKLTAPDSDPAADVSKGEGDGGEEPHSDGPDAEADADLDALTAAEAANAPAPGQRRYPKRYKTPEAEAQAAHDKARLRQGLTEEQWAAQAEARRVELARERAAWKAVVSRKAAQQHVARADEFERQQAAAAATRAQAAATAAAADGGGVSSSVGTEAVPDVVDVAPPQPKVLPTERLPLPPASNPVLRRMASTKVLQVPESMPHDHALQARGLTAQGFKANKFEVAEVRARQQVYRALTELLTREDFLSTAVRDSATQKPSAYKPSVDLRELGWRVTGLDIAPKTHTATVSWQLSVDPNMTLRGEAAPTDASAADAKGAKGGGETARRFVERILERSVGALRFALANTVDRKYVPHIRFEYVGIGSAVYRAQQVAAAKRLATAGGGRTLPRVMAGIASELKTLEQSVVSADAAAAELPWAQGARERHRAEAREKQLQRERAAISPAPKLAERPDPDQTVDENDEEDDADATAEEEDADALDAEAAEAEADADATTVEADAATAEADTSADAAAAQEMADALARGRARQAALSDPTTPAMLSHKRSRHVSAETIKQLEVRAANRRYTDSTQLPRGRRGSHTRRRG